MKYSKFSNYVRCTTCNEIIYFEDIMMRLKNNLWEHECPKCGNDDLVNVERTELKKLNKKEFNPSRLDNGEYTWERKKNT